MFYRSPNLEEITILEQTLYKEANDVLYEEIDNCIECDFIKKCEENELSPLTLKNGSLIRITTTLARNENNI